MLETLSSETRCARPEGLRPNTGVRPWKCEVWQMDLWDRSSK